MTPHPDRLSGRVALPVIRSLAVLGFIAVFYTAASLFTPADSTATPAQPISSARDRSFANTQRLIPTTQPAFVGALIGAHGTLDIYITASGARYTVKSPDDVVLAELLSADELYRQYPEFDIDHMRADAPVIDED